MTTPPVGTSEFRDEVIRIAELTVTTLILDGLTFQNCRIIGPAILVPMEDVNITHCQWDTPNPADLFWIIPPERQIIIGAVGVNKCTFSRCSFTQVGLGGPAEFRDAMIASFGSA